MCLCVCCWSFFRPCSSCTWIDRLHQIQTAASSSRLRAKNTLFRGAFGTHTHTHAHSHHTHAHTHARTHFNAHALLFDLLFVACFLFSFLKAERMQFDTLRHAAYSSVCLLFLLFNKGAHVNSRWPEAPPQDKGFDHPASNQRGHSTRPSAQAGLHSNDDDDDDNDNDNDDVDGDDDTSSVGGGAATGRPAGSHAGRGCGSSGGDDSDAALVDRNMSVEVYDPDGGGTASDHEDGEGRRCHDSMGNVLVEQPHAAAREAAGAHARVHKQEAHEQGSHCSSSSSGGGGGAKAASSSAACSSTASALTVTVKVEPGSSDASGAAMKEEPANSSRSSSSASASSSSTREHHAAPPKKGRK